MPHLVNAETDEILLPQLQIADTFWKRFAGLQFRRSLAPDSGLLLSPCSSLHTCFMRFPIDIIMLDTDRAVIGIRRRVEPWRIMLCESGTKQVIEVMPGSLTLATGTKLKWIEEPS